MSAKNRTAFLDMLAFSEGTFGIGDDGYDVLFGATAKAPKLFVGYDDHPRHKTYEKNDEFIRNGKKDFTTAAGRYQITMTNFDAYKKRLGLTDFSPYAQDRIALQLIAERRAIPDIDAGLFSSAIKKCAPVWASLPGAGYGQPEQKLEKLLAFAKKRGAELNEVA